MLLVGPAYLASSRSLCSGVGLPRLARSGRTLPNPRLVSTHMHREDDLDLDVDAAGARTPTKHPSKHTTKTLTKPPSTKPPSKHPAKYPAKHPIKHPTKTLTKPPSKRPTKSPIKTPAKHTAKHSAAHRVTFLFVTWGQLLDHDITLTAETKGMVWSAWWVGNIPSCAPVFCSCLPPRR